MFKHYLINKNERVTETSKFKFLQLNKGLVFGLPAEKFDSLIPCSPNAVTSIVTEPAIIGAVRHLIYASELVGKTY